MLGCHPDERALVDDQDLFWVVLLETELFLVVPSWVALLETELVSVLLQTELFSVVLRWCLRRVKREHLCAVQVEAPWWSSQMQRWRA